MGVFKLRYDPTRVLDLGNAGTWPRTMGDCRPRAIRRSKAPVILAFDKRPPRVARDHTAGVPCVVLDEGRETLVNSVMDVALGGIF